MISEADDCDDIVYNTPENVRNKSRNGGQIKLLNRNQPGKSKAVAVQRKGKNAVEKTNKYDMHGRPIPAKKKMSDKTYYDDAGHIRKHDDASIRKKLNAPMNRRNNEYERQHPAKKNQRFQKAPHPAARKYNSPSRSVSVPVIRIKKADDRIPAATGVKKNIKSPFVGMLKNI